MNISRIVPVTAALAVVLAACGSDTPSADGQPVDTPDTTVDAGGLRAPTPISIVGGGTAAQGSAETAAAAEPSPATDAMIAPYRIISEFVAGDGLGALPNDTTGYVFDAGSMPSASDAARIAAALGVSGEPQLIDDGYAVSYRVGPDDGSAPSVVVWDDAMLSWNYSRAWEDVASACAVAGSTGVAEPIEVQADTAGDAADVAPDETKALAVAPDESVATEPSPQPPTDETVVAEPPPDRPVAEPVECVQPEPPTGVPTAAEAEARVVGLLGALGVDAATVSFDTWADEWSASVTAHEKVGDVVVRSWGFGFGGDAELQYASGSVATPEPVGPYDLIDLDTALARLNDGRYGYGSYSGGVGIPIAEAGVATDVAVSSDVAAPVEQPVEDSGEVPAPEEITVTLTGVQPDLWWIWDVDGSAWLVPAYRFTGDDGGTYSVPAVTDDFLVEVEQPVDQPVEQPVDQVGVPEPAPPPVEPAPAPDEADNGTDAGAEPTTPGDAQVAIVEVRDGVGFYPACGTETLDVDGTTWYPVTDHNDAKAASILDEIDATAREPFPVATGFARVAPPGPGDDVGTLVVWADGIARWISDSGNLDVWLVTEELTYDWVC